MERDPIVAIGLLGETHLEMLKDCLPKVFPITNDGRFDDLLMALDEADAARTDSTEQGD